jgi:hypothetical protein
MSPKFPFAPGRGCAVLALHAAALLGCGESPRHRSERPVLVLEDAAAPAVAPFERHVVELPAQERAWAGGGRFAVALPQDLGLFDAVVVRGRLHGAHRLELRLSSPAGERRMARHVLPDDDATAEWILAPRDGVALRASTIELVVAGPRCEIDSLAFVQLPLALRLFPPGCERSLLLEGDGRVAVGLQPGRALTAELHPHRTGDTLELSVARWPARPGDAGGAALLLEFDTPQGLVQRPLELGASQDWRAVTYPLTDMLVGARRVRLRSAGDDGAPLALADLWLGQRSASAPSVLLVTAEANPGWRLEALAERGVLFGDCRAAIPGRVSVQAALGTGLSPRDTRFVDDVARLGPEAFTLGEAFRAAGFRVFGALGSSELGPREGGVAQGFDRLELSGEAHDAGAAVRRLLEWVDEAEGQPVFAWLHLSRAQAESEQRAQAEHLEEALVPLLEHERLFGGVTAFAARRGGEPGDAPLPANLRTSLALAWPDAPAGRRVQVPVELLDLGATLLELSGAPRAGFPGGDLRGALATDAQPSPARFALGEGGTSASVTAGDEVLVLQLEEPGPSGLEPGRHACALFDGAADPAGRTDLSGQRPQRVRALRALLVDWLARAERSGGGPAWIDPGCTCAACATWRASL